MARPKRENAEYFTHDANMRNNVRVKALRRKFSHKGYAVWCFLLETLTNEEFFEIKYNEIGKELLAADFDIQVEELDNIVDYCCMINLLQKENDVIFSNALKRRFEGLINKRKANNERFLRLKQTFEGVSDAETYEKNDLSHKNAYSKVEESKGEESIGNESIGKESKVEESIGKDYKGKGKGINDTLVNSPFDLERIIAIWNEEIKTPKVAKLTEDRKKKIKARIEDWHTQDNGTTEVFARTIFRKIAMSDFLSGRKGEWQATFDWLFANDKNYVKVLEGNYDNHKGQDTVHEQPSNLGVGEYITQEGRRTYGTGKATIPMDARPRPSERYSWNAESKSWIIQ